MVVLPGRLESMIPPWSYLNPSQQRKDEGCIVHHNFTTSRRSCRKVEVEGVEAVAEVDKVE